MTTAFKRDARIARRAKLLASLAAKDEEMFQGKASGERKLRVRWHRGVLQLAAWQEEDPIQLDSGQVEAQTQRQ